MEKTVAKPEVGREFATVAQAVANGTDDDEFLDDIDRGKFNDVDEISRGWRLEKNSDGRLRWRWQVKDGIGNTVTYVKNDGSVGYSRGSKYVGITKSDEARAKDRKRTKGKHKRGRRRAAGG